MLRQHRDICRPRCFIFGHAAHADNNSSNSESINAKSRADVLFGCRNAWNAPLLHLN